MLISSTVVIFTMYMYVKMLYTLNIHSFIFFFLKEPVLTYEHSQLGSHSAIPFCKLQNCFFEISP